MCLGLWRDGHLETLLFLPPSIPLYLPLSLLLAQLLPLLRADHVVVKEGKRKKAPDPERWEMPSGGSD